MPLQNNLPHAPVSWLAVQGQFHDLVVSTYGRGFWILDDLTPLRALGDSLAGRRAALLPIRYREAAGRPHRCRGGAWQRQQDERGQDETPRQRPMGASERDQHRQERAGRPVS
jgi:hypothetical protein